LFAKVGCVHCHTPSFTTGTMIASGSATSPSAALRAHRSKTSEANKVIEHFNKLTVQEQQEIIDFLRSL
jgi:hypothetical protein